MFIILLLLNWHQQRCNQIAPLCWCSAGARCSCALVKSMSVLEKCRGRVVYCISFLLLAVLLKELSRKASLCAYKLMYTLKLFFQGFYVTFNWKLFGTFQFVFVLTRVFGLRSVFLQSSYYSSTFFQLKSLNLNVIIPEDGGETDGRLRNGDN